MDRVTRMLGTSLLMFHETIINAQPTRLLWLGLQLFHNFSLTHCKTVIGEGSSSSILPRHLVLSIDQVLHVVQCLVGGTVEQSHDTHVTEG